MSESVWRIGYHAVDITPRPGAHLSGYALRRQGATGVLDPVFARALLLDDGVRQGLIISCDLLGFESADAHEIKQAIDAEIGVPAEHVLLAATHTHSGPASMRTNGIGDRDEGWMQKLKARIVQAAAGAAQKQEPATISFSPGRTDIGLNRRGRIPPGSIHPVPDAAGVVDTTLTVLIIRRPRQKEPRLVLFNCGCHPTVLGADNRRVSADFPGHTIRRLQAVSGGALQAMFLNGAAGNVNPRGMGTPGLLTHLSKRLQRQILTLMEGESHRIPARLSASSRRIAVPFAPVPMLQQCRQMITHYENALQQSSSEEERILHIARLRWAQQLYNRVAGNTAPGEVEAELQVLQIGEVVLIALPFEVFAETGLALRRQAPAATLVCGYANGNFGYLPPASEIARGGYEVEEAHKFYNQPAHFAVDAEEQVRAGVAALFK